MKDKREDYISRLLAFLDTNKIVVLTHWRRGEGGTFNIGIMIQSHSIGTFQIEKLIPWNLSEIAIVKGNLTLYFNTIDGKEDELPHKH